MDVKKEYLKERMIQIIGGSTMNRAEIIRAFGWKSISTTGTTGKRFITALKELENEGKIVSETYGKMGVRLAYRLTNGIATSPLLTKRPRKPRTISPNRAGRGLFGAPRIMVIKKAILEQLQYPMKQSSLSEKLGFSRSGVSAALKSRKGGLWLAINELMNEGKIRYDGKRFYPLPTLIPFEVKPSHLQKMPASPQEALEVLLESVRNEAQKTTIRKSYVDQACAGYVKLIKRLEDQLRGRVDVQKYLHF